MKRDVSLLRFSLTGVSALALSLGCSAILGIEDLKSGPAPGDDAGAGGADGSGGADGTGGAAAGGSKSSGGSSNSGGGSETDGGGTSSGGSAAGGTPGDGGAGGAGGTPANGGTAGTGGAVGTGGTPGTTGPVHGKIIDFWKHAIPQATVMIGSTTTTTNASGEFTVAGISGAYDVDILVTPTVSNVTTNYAWRYEGLTRKDPTLQVYRGLPQRSNDINVHIQNVTFPLKAAERVAFDFAGPDGEFGDTVDSADTDFLSPTWVGPASTSGTSHALLWTVTDPADLPASYLAHSSRPTAVSETSSGDVTFDLTHEASTPLPVGNITGSTTGGSGGQAQNYVFLRFSDGAVIQLVSDYKAPSPYTYVVPTIQGSTITAATIRGFESQLPYEVAYRDDLAAGQTNVALVVPKAATPITPGSGATVDATTAFTWVGTAGVFVFRLESSLRNDTAFVVTAAHTAKVPKLFPLESKADYSWNLETHGAATSMDAAAGPEGSLDQFSGNGMPRGLKHGTGSFTRSQSVDVTTK